MIGLVRIAVSTSLALALVACGDPSVSIPDAGGGAYASTPPPDRPSLDPTASRIPYPVLTLRGRASGTSVRRVIVEGAGNPIASTLLPDGSFCVDVPLAAAGFYSFQVFAQALDGQVSAPSGPVEVSYDPAAPPIPNAETCSGADPAGCPSAREICGNGRDDDCNNLSDDRDPACATCVDDALEPNDTASAPRIEPGRYDGLHICPADEDYYGVFARADDQLQVRLFFVDAQGNLDLHLLGVGGRTTVARSTSVTDDESVTYTATTTGQYVIRVFSDSGASNAYTLDLRISSP